jgi:hypothetical protein
MAEPNDGQGFSVGRKSLIRIGNSVRETETGMKIPGELRGPNRRRAVPIVEGILLDDLDATDDPNVPTSARFQIKTAIQGSDSWANEPAPSIVKVLNRTANSWSAETVGLAKEIHQDKWYFTASGSGGGTHWIEFTVADVYCPGDYDYDDDQGKGRWYVDAEVNWYTGGCSTNPPGYDSYSGLVRIFDTCILKYYTVDQLQGTSPPYVEPMTGDAIWIYPFGGEECIPEWHVKAVCGVPSCGDSVSPPVEEEE